MEAGMILTHGRYTTAGIPVKCIAKDLDCKHEITSARITYDKLLNAYYVICPYCETQLSVERFIRTFS